MKRYIAVDMSRAYLLARMAHEGRKVSDDDWLSNERRLKAGALYVEAGKDFNNFFTAMKDISRCEMIMTRPDDIQGFVDELPGQWYSACVNALKVFRDNLDIVWMYAYSGKVRKMQWLTK
jgi:hypothetical protein